ncbi:MAG: SpoIIE family protein phosphatase [Micrococcales bacterium]|nr:SpoIIE family protein phosphatase [Micrococcales bacterium]MCL2667338.1 SpoIIE family protein phosphatase [Micrococcales bacterium]
MDVGNREPDRDTPPLLDEEAEPTASVTAPALTVVVTDDDHMSIQPDMRPAPTTVNRLELLARVSDAVSEHLDYHQAADALVEIAVPPLAQWGFVALLAERGGAFEHVRIATGEPAKAAAARGLENLDHSWLVMSDAVREAVHADPDDVLVPRVMDTDLLARKVSADHYALLEELGLGHWLLVPLCARDRTIGLLGLVHPDPGALDIDTIVTATHLGRVGLALDNVRLYLSERRSALTLQHRLLPRATDVPGIDVSATYLPSGQRAEVGGDWYDVLPVERGAVFTVGDIVGHDMTAAAAMGQVSSLLRARQWGGESPAQALGALASLVEGLGWDDVASIVCLRITMDEGADHVSAEYVNAGHPAPFVCRPDGKVYQLERAQTLPVGLLNPGAVQQEELTLPLGSTVVLYTDGLVERRGRSLADGLQALEQALRGSCGTTAREVRDHLVSALVDEHHEDDLCLLVVRCPTAEQSGHPEHSSRNEHSGHNEQSGHQQGGRQPRAAHQARSAAAAASSPNGPRSRRRSSKNR